MTGKGSRMDYYNPPPRPKEDYKPISPWGYIGYQFVFSLPVIGLIVCIVLAFASSNRNVKNFAAAQLIIVTVVVVIAVLCCVIFGVSFAQIGEMINTGEYP